MGSLGCCTKKPQTIENEDATDSKKQNTFAPPGNSAYQVDYIPPSNVNLAIHQAQRISVVGKNPISPASNQNHNQLKTDDKMRNANEIGQIQRDGRNNVFRESRVPIPVSAPISVQLHDLKTFN